MAEAGAMQLLEGMLLGWGLQHLPKVMQALQKTNMMGAMTGGGQGDQGDQGAGGPLNIDPNVLLPLLLPLLQGQQPQQPPGAGPVPGLGQPPVLGGTPPPPPMGALPPRPLPSMGRVPNVPRMLPMSAGVPY